MIEAYFLANLHQEGLFGKDLEYVLTIFPISLLIRGFEILIREFPFFNWPKTVRFPVPEPSLQDYIYYSSIEMQYMFFLEVMSKIFHNTLKN